MGGQSPTPTPAPSAKVTEVYLKVQEKKIWVRPREEMADFLNVTRPALSREISAMVEEGIIRAGQGYLVILDQEALEEYL